MMARSLSDFAEGAAPIPKAPPSRIHEAAPRKYDGKLLAFDPSLAHCGWVVFDHGNIVTTGDTTTAQFSDNKTTDRMQRAAALWTQLVGLVSGITPDVIVYEAPEMAGAMKFWDPSPLIASTVISVLSQQLFIPTAMVRTAFVKEHVLGKKSAKKSEIAAAMRARFGTDLKVAKIAPLNEHVFDAIAVAVTCVEKGMV
jgi:Holliday junction resolvasome RuvABC endonuclease subunit